MADLTIASLLAPSIEPAYAAVATAIGDRLGLTTDLVTGSYRRYREDAYDVAFICGLAYVEFDRAGEGNAVAVAAPVLTGDRYGERPIYFSDVIVGRASRFRSFQDLAGASWAYNEPLSQSGHGIVRHHLLTLGETNGFFGRVVEAGFHTRSLEMVRSTEIDAAAIDSHVLAVAMRDDPGLSESIRVVATLGPSTIQPVTVSRRLDEAMRSQISDVLTSIHGDPTHRAALDACMIERFVTMGPHDYDDVRAMAAACEAAGFLEAY